MKIKIKQLRQNNEIFVPQTTAEAVLVKHNGTVSTLDTVLKKKIEQITPGPELTVIPTKQTVIIKHANEVDPIENERPLLVKYNSTGHITGSKPMGKLTINVNGTKHMEVDGTSDQTLSMGDDFTVDNNFIQLKWNNL